MPSMSSTPEQRSAFSQFSQDVPDAVYPTKFPSHHHLSSSQDNESSDYSDGCSYIPTEEYRTWLEFKQIFTIKFANERLVKRYTLDERIREARNAQYLISRAIKALERIIQEHSSSSLWNKSQHERCQRDILELRKDQDLIDDALAALNLMQNSTTLTGRESSHETRDTRHGIADLIDGSETAHVLTSHGYLGGEALLDSISEVLLKEDYRKLGLL